MGINILTYLRAPLKLSIHLKSGKTFLQAEKNGPLLGIEPGRMAIVSEMTWLSFSERTKPGISMTTLTPNQRMHMKKLFSLTKFMPDTTYLQVLQVVSDKPNCNIGDIVSRLLPEHSEYTVRSKVRQLILRDYLSEDCLQSEILLSITAKGRGLLEKPVS
jgi:hypothetical protein